VNYFYYRSCVGWPTGHVDALIEAQDTAINITRKTFLKHVGLQSTREIELMLGYDKHPSQGLTMAADFSVSYHRSKIFGFVCYYIRHSSIEYVFMPEGSEKKIPF
jgi:hypothetical protein